ncbi:PhaM family polyhydroxyalkanoate granule multifunctional regulatory protein [Uliginosibacterium sp. H3]|uniref:PhaM family polyhydroxyalkanoate granule multifunctional regulatory protein n=1 Tax=Uliginosibacterium silvisoli TaxID=3114758 RepID=A0ABU6JX75_9RHOO|nr:PhaM family polyhydroxyalkanoate granule multifunctional regulatory protein [Uliginosibacterium sp. H3]
MTTPQDNNTDFVRQMWSNLGFGLPGMVTPTLDVDEISKRITDLRAVEGWLKMNLSMLQMTIQGLEVQGAALSAVRAMSQPGENGELPANPFANPALWTWPFAQAASAATDTSPADEPPPDTGARPAPRRNTKK